MITLALLIGSKFYVHHFLLLVRESEEFTVEILYEGKTIISVPLRHTAKKLNIFEIKHNLRNN